MKKKKKFKVNTNASSAWGFLIPENRHGQREQSNLQPKASNVIIRVFYRPTD